MKTNIEEKKKLMLQGARIATSDQVVNNEFMQKVEKELAELKAEKEARVAPRAER